MYHKNGTFPDVGDDVEFNLLTFGVTLCHSDCCNEQLTLLKLALHNIEYVTCDLQCQVNTIILETLQKLGNASESFEERSAVPGLETSISGKSDRYISTYIMLHNSKH